MTTAMMCTGDVGVLDAFSDTNRRLGVVTCAGGNRNAFAAGALISLRRRRLSNIPVAYAGVSSGIPTSAYIMGNAAASSVRVFADDMSDSRMFSISRRLLGRYPFDVDYVDRVFRGQESDRGIPAAHVCDHPARLYAVLGHAQTGESLIYNPEEPEDVWQLAVCGTAVTGFARPLTYHGAPVTDGFFTDQHLPVEWLVEQEDLTDVLVFAGQHHQSEPQVAPALERSLYQLGIASADQGILELILSRNVRFMDTAHRIVARKDIRVLIVWMTDKVSQLYISQKKSRALIRQGYSTMEALFVGRHR